MCCIVLSGEPYLLVFPLQVIKCSFSSLNLSALGIYGARLISPSELKISSMSAEVENVLSVSSCWRPKPILLFPSFFFFFISLFSSCPVLQTVLTFSSATLFLYVFYFFLHALFCCQFSQDPRPDVKPIFTKRMRAKLVTL